MQTIAMKKLEQQKSSLNAKVTSTIERRSSASDARIVPMAAQAMANSKRGDCAKLQDVRSRLSTL